MSFATMRLRLCHVELANVTICLLSGPEMNLEISADMQQCISLGQQNTPLSQIHVLTKLGGYEQKSHQRRFSPVKSRFDQTRCREMIPVLQSFKPLFAQVEQKATIFLFQ